MTGSQYRAVFSNAAGTVATTAAALTVSPAPSAPILKSSPASASVAAGASVSFTASASGSPTPTVQWQVSTNNSLTWTNIPGAMSTTYSVTATTAMTGSQYRAVFNNASGTVASSAAVLTVELDGGVEADREEQPRLGVGRGRSFGQLHRLG